jgi:YbbR domain-containing protein
LTIKKPSGVREISEVSTTVTVDVEKEVTKEIEDILLQWENLSENYSPNAASEADRYVTVVVRGVESVINEITKDNINVYVDLKGYGPGTHDVDVIVTGKDEKGKDVRISYDSKVSKVTWIISKKR